jgi:predicted NBD/HSP70 family sugar kinase
MPINGPEHVRQVNLSAMLRRLHMVGPTSRSDLGNWLGLTRSTTGLLVADLSEKGLVFETPGPLSRTPGRPSTIVHPNSQGVVAIAGQIEADLLGVSLVGLGGRSLYTKLVDRDPSRLAPPETVHDLTDMVREALATVPGDCRIAGIGVSFCGVVRLSDGHVHAGPNVGWRDVPLGKMLRQSLVPERHDLPLLVINDSDGAAVAEHLRGRGVGIHTMIYVAGEVGVGAGIIVHDKLLEGTSVSAGEIGHWPLNPHGRRCRCGGTGCWETEASQLALLRHAGIQANPPYREAVSRIVRAARDGDTTARKAVSRVGYWLGVGLSGAANVFDPEMIVLGGLFAEIFPIVEDQLRRIIRSRVMLPGSATLAIAPESLGPSCSLVGAAESAFERLLASPSLFEPVSIVLEASTV